MIRPTILCGLLAMAGVVTAAAEDFPLAFHTIPAKDVMSFPGGSVTYALMRQDKPAKLVNEPKATSRHPLYGEFRGGAGTAGLICRLDESKGDGQGYDQLIVDMNQNGDLTDDPVVQRITLPSDRPTPPEQMLFGPIMAPAGKTIAGGRPVYFARAYLYNRQLLSSGQSSPSMMYGQLILKAGWYLDTTVTLDGLKERVGVVDANSNLRLGDIAQPQTYTNRSEVAWYFRSGDVLLVDADGSGRFESSMFENESRPFGPILYLGSKAYKVALASDCKTLRVEPWAGPLAEVALKPQGDQVRDVTLAWEQPDGRWQLIRPAVSDGKIMVPPGNYRLYECNLAGKSASRDQIMVAGMQRVPQTPVNVVAGKANTFDCGAPLEIKVTAVKSRTTYRLALGEEADDTTPNSGYTLRINANVVGAGGEVYSAFQKGDRRGTRPAKPSFRIVLAGGKTLAEGNLEFG